MTTYSLLIFNPAYYSKFFASPKDVPSKLNAVGESSFFFAVLGSGLYAIMGICSMPSVGSQMTSKQWQVVYGPIAWIALAFGTIHVMIMGVKGWDDQEKWPGGLPPITMTSVLIPLLVMWLKLVQVLLTRFQGAVQPTKNFKYRNARRESAITCKDEGMMSATFRFRDDEERSSGMMTPLALENGSDAGASPRSVAA